MQSISLKVFTWPTDSWKNKLVDVDKRTQKFMDCFKEIIEKLIVSLSLFKLRKVYLGHKLIES